MPDTILPLHGRQADVDLGQAKRDADVALRWLEGAFARPQTAYDGPPITLRVTGHPPETAAAVVDVMKPSFALLTRMSGGKILVEDSWGASVHRDRDGARALREGLTDFCPVYSGWEPEHYPMAQALQLPGLFPSSEVGTHVSERLYDRFFREDVERQGILMGRMKTSGGYHLFSMEPIRSLEDLQGLRVGATEGVESDVIAALGATPVGLSSLEMFPALNEGRIDAMHLADGSSEVFGIGRIAKYRLHLALVRQNLEFGLRRAFWEALPAALKPVLNAWLRGEAQAETQVFYGVAGAKARARFAERGMEFVYLDEAEAERWKTRGAPAIDAFVAAQEAAGRPAAALVAAIRAEVEAAAGMSPDALMTAAIERPVADVNR